MGRICVDKFVDDFLGLGRPATVKERLSQTVGCLRAIQVVGIVGQRLPLLLGLVITA